MASPWMGNPIDHDGIQLQHQLNPLFQVWCLQCWPLVRCVKPCNQVGVAAIHPSWAVELLALRLARTQCYFTLCLNSKVDCKSEFSRSTYSQIGFAITLHTYINSVGYWLVEQGHSWRALKELFQGYLSTFGQKLTTVLHMLYHWS